MGGGVEHLAEAVQVLVAVYKLVQSVSPVVEILLNIYRPAWKRNYRKPCNTPGELQQTAKVSLEEALL